MTASPVCCVDANVFVAAARPVELHYADSRSFLAQVLRRRVSLIAPSLLLPEVAAAIPRPTGNEMLALATVARIRSIPTLQFAPLNEALADSATLMAAAYRLRGADAVYLAVARAYGVTLGTWDQEMLQRGPAVVPTMTPADWLRSAAGS